MVICDSSAYQDGFIWLLDVQCRIIELWTVTVFQWVQAHDDDSELHVNLEHYIVLNGLFQRSGECSDRRFKNRIRRLYKRKLRISVVHPSGGKPDKFCRRHFSGEHDASRMLMQWNWTSVKLHGKYASRNFFIVTNEL